MESDGPGKSLVPVIVILGLLLLSMTILTTSLDCFGGHRSSSVDEHAQGKTYLGPGSR